MAVRKESVKLDLEDNFTRKMLAAAAATKTFEDALDDLDGTSVRSSKSTRDLDRDVGAFGATSRRADLNINKLTGRIAVMARVASILGPAMVPIGAVGVPALTALASQLGFATLGMGSLVAASQGVGEALDAVNKSALEPTAANLEAAQVAMANLGPQAQGFVSRMQELRPILTEIRDTAAAGWFPGLTESLDSFERLAPKVADIFGAVGAAGGSLIAEGAKALEGPGWSSFMTFIENEAPVAIEQLGRTVGNVASAAADMWMAFQPLNRDVSAGLLRMSQDFADWADGLGSSQGFQEFIAYVRDNGPKVVELGRSIADAVIQIAEAAAPLGGPVLDALTSLVRVVGGLADSPLGTPLIAAATALSTYSLAAGAAAKAQGAFNTALGVSKGGGWGRQAAMIGTLGIAASGAADGLGLTNAASGALIGTFAGPWGAAIGGGIGVVMDMIDANNSWEESIRNVDKAIASGSLDAMRSELSDLESTLKELQDMEEPENAGQLASSLATGLGWWVSGAPDVDERIESTKDEIARLEGQISSAEQATLGYSNSLERTAAAAGMTGAELHGLINAMNAQRDAALGAFDAETRYRNALKAAGAQARRNEAGIRGNSIAALENRQALSELAGAWNNQSKAVRNNSDRYREARRAFVETATAMGVPEEAAKRLAHRLLDIPDRRQTRIALDGDQRARDTLEQYLGLLGDVPPGKNTKVDATDHATPTLRDILGGINALHDKDVTITTYHRDIHTQLRNNGIDDTPGQADGGTVGRYAYGGTVRGRRQPYGDKVLTYLAPGEEVISNRYGQADRHRALLKAINANRGSERRVSATGTSGGGVVTHRVEVVVTGEMDLQRAKAQIRQLATDVAASEIEADHTWRNSQRGA